MAFLCPSRKKTSKIRIKGPPPLPGRITGSASIDTLVRVGLEKEHGTRTPMVVLHDFTPCVDDELVVKRNQVVQLLYQENDWMYVIAEDGKEGFIPYTYCLPVQRSVDDIVQYKSKKKRDGEKENLISPPPYNTSHNVRQSNGHTLVRSASKSLPDISDLSSSESAGFSSRRTRNKTKNAEKHSSRSSKATGYTNKAFNIRVHDVADSSALHSNSNNNDSDPLLESSVSDMRIASAALREKQKQFYQSHKQTTKSTSVATHSEPSSPKSTRSNPSVTSATHSSHQHSKQTSRDVLLAHEQYSSSASKSGVADRRTAIQQHRYSNMAYNAYVHGFGNNRNAQARSRAGSASAVESVLNKSWGPSSGQTLLRHPGRSLTHSINAQPSSSSSSAYNSSHPYTSHTHSAGMTSLQQRHAQNNRHSYHSAFEQSLHSPATSSNDGKSQTRKFHKTAQGQYIVLFQFTAQQENDISVDRGEFVTVLNKDDTDWYWIKRSDKQEGFVPSNYVRQADAIPIHPGSVRSSHQSLNDSALNSHQSLNDSALNSRRHGNTHAPVQQQRHDAKPQQPASATTARQSNHSNAAQQPIKLAVTSQPTNQQAARTSTRLVCLYNFKAQAHDDLSVTRGEWLYADMVEQDDADWLWVFSPSQSMAGYIPRTYAKPPDVNFMQHSR